LELCAYHGHQFPKEHWCSGSTVIRVKSGSYEHCDDDDCLTDNRCPLSTSGCSVTLTDDDTWRSLLDECNDRPGCSVAAGRSWSFSCLSLLKTDYMKIVYDCVDPSSSSAAAAAAAATTTTEVVTRENTAGWSGDEARKTRDRQHTALIITAGQLSHCLSLCTSVCLSVCLCFSLWRSN